VVLWSVVLCAVVLWSVVAVVWSAVEVSPLDRPSEVADNPVCELSVAAAVGSVNELVVAVPVAACELELDGSLVDEPVVCVPVFEFVVEFVVELAVVPEVPACEPEASVAAESVGFVPAAALPVVALPAVASPAVALPAVAPVVPACEPVSVLVGAALPVPAAVCVPVPVPSVPPAFAVGVEPRSAPTLSLVCASWPLAAEPPRSAWGAVAPVVAWPECVVV
jgi:hypothetical protein